MAVRTVRGVIEAVVHDRVDGDDVGRRRRESAPRHRQGAAVLVENRDRATLRRRLHRDRPVQLSVRLVHDVALRAHVGAPEEPVRRPHPDAEPGWDVGPDEADDGRGDTIHRVRAKDADRRRARPEVSVVTRRPAEAGWRERRLDPRSRAGPPELVQAGEDLGRVVDRDLGPVRGLEFVCRDDRRPVPAPLQSLGEDRGLQCLFAGQRLSEFLRAVKRREGRGRLDRDRAAIGVDRDGEVPFAGLPEGRCAGEAAESTGLVERGRCRGVA